MIHLFKNKEYRPLAILMSSLFAYLLLFLADIIISITAHKDPFTALMKGCGIVLNLFLIVFAIMMWRRNHKWYVEKEREQIEKPQYSFTEQELRELEESGVETKFLQPINYKKWNRQTAWMWSACILFNLILIGTHFW